MSDDLIIEELLGAANAAFVLAGPILIVALAIAVCLGLVQAAMQLQEQTIPQIVKIGTISVMLVSGGLALSAPLVDYARHVFTDFPTLVR